MKPPIITLLTDFGLRDHYVAAMKGVMLGICPEARLIDITHDAPPFDVADAAFTLAQAWPYFPDGTVHLVVVDPGVGSDRRPIIAERRGHLFVAPDNGVLTLVSPSRFWKIQEGRFLRERVSATFHGRDIFSPVAAHLAMGTSPQDIGPEIGDAVRLTITEPVQKGQNVWTGVVLHIDRYGNVVTNFRSEDFAECMRPGFEMAVGAGKVTQYRRYYSEADPGALFAIPGSSGMLEISVNKGNAASSTGVATGAAVELTTAGSHSGVLVP